MEVQQSKHTAKASTTGAPRRSVHDPANGHFRALTLYAEDSDCVKAARDMVGSNLQTWGLAYAVDDARLIVSELVGNVVHHAIPDDCLAMPGAGRRIDVWLMTWPGLLGIGVLDEDSTPPDLPAGEFISPDLAGDFVEALLPDRGRGLLIVQRLADAVWWSPGLKGSGKTVWARLDLDRLWAESST
ncbi:ATP-binding protein [Streptomyces sp. TRM72054]|uniref:ATP-binding protein n=1 Tax=Streptomyces sp. TRM72054 TaxID=2870562 RepID=UPI001C8CC155|nr:ATP-binding protein [Streptomyces sp. TRM72054]MBX9396173.1 ATP-binding protein [Streptomyces sp. TRM72054]